MQQAPVFGKRSLSPSQAAPRAVAAAPAPEHAAIFAAARAEQAEDERSRVVPRSLRAATLAGLVVGCCLAGLDAMRAGDTLRALSHGLLSGDATPPLVPVVVALGLYGGARTAAIVLIVAHAALRHLEMTSHAAYAAAGGAVALAFSTLSVAAQQAGLVDAALLSSHGPALDAAAGIGAGFLYRVLAGAGFKAVRTGSPG